MIGFFFHCIFGKTETTKHTISEKEKKILQEKYKHYLTILDTYRKVQDQLSLSNEEYENHINDILDELNKLRNKLNIKEK